MARALMPNVYEDVIKYLPIQELLSNCPYRLLQEMTVEEFTEPGQFYLEQGKCYPVVYILVEGETEIYITSPHGHKATLIIYDKPGTLIGEQEAILSEAYSASVKNLSVCRLIKMSVSVFKEWLQSDQSFNAKFIENQCEQVHQLAIKTGLYTLYNAKEQVALTLLSYHSRGQAVTKIDIQQSVVTSTRNINRILSDLVQKGFIKMDHTLITILDKEALTFYGEE